MMRRKLEVVRLPRLVMFNHEDDRACGMSYRCLASHHCWYLTRHEIVALTACSPSRPHE